MLKWEKDIRSILCQEVMEQRVKKDQNQILNLKMVMKTMKAGGNNNSKREIIAILIYNLTLIVHWRNKVMI